MCDVLSKDDKRSVRNFFDAIEIKNELRFNMMSDEKYTIKEIDKVCENLEEYKNSFTENKNKNQNCEISQILVKNSKNL
jgi:hypothetical protein